MDKPNSKENKHKSRCTECPSYIDLTNKKHRPKPQFQSHLTVLL